VPDKLGDNEQEEPIHSHVADGKGLPCNLLEIYSSNGRVLDTLRSVNGSATGTQCR
jgi:hypothetical protein